MATAYPGALDNFANPAATDPMNSAAVPHAAQHANANDAIEAIEALLGITSNPWPGGINSVGQSSKFGVGAVGGAGTYAQISGTPTEVYFQAFGTPADIGVIFQPKGTSGYTFRKGDGSTAMTLDNAGVVQASGSLRCGADSGGLAGFTTITAIFAIGNGAGVNLTTPAKGTGGGPSSTQAGQWVKIYLGGAIHWIPAFS